MSWPVSGYLEREWYMDLVLRLVVGGNVVVVRRAEMGGAKEGVRLRLDSWRWTDCSLI